MPAYTVVVRTLSSTLGLTRGPRTFAPEGPAVQISLVGKWRSQNPREALATQLPRFLQTETSGNIAPEDTAAGSLWAKLPYPQLGSTPAGLG